MNLSGNKIWFFSFSSIIILIGIIFIFMGGLKPGIDFTGGSSLTIKLSSYDSSENIREALVGTEFESSIVQFSSRIDTGCFNFLPTIKIA